MFPFSVETGRKLSVLEGAACQDEVPVKVLTWASRVASSWLDVVYPLSCVACGERLVCSRQALSLCPVCELTVEAITSPQCISCGQETLSLGDLCDKCLRDHRVFWGRAVFYYGGALKEAYWKGKFRGRLDIIRRLGRTLGIWAVNELDTRRYDGLVAIPPSSSRLRSRGYDPTTVLAKSLARKTTLPVWSLLRRTRDAKPQSGFAWDARKTNVRGLFQVKKGQDLGGKSLLLFDDIMTTGATLKAATNALYLAGAFRVDLLTLFRTTL